VFLKLGSAEPQVFAKGCQGFRKTTMRIGGRVLLAVLNLYVQIKIRVAHSTLIIPSLAASRQSVAPAIQKLRQTLVKLVSTARHRQSHCVRRNDQVIEQFEKHGSKRMPTSHVYYVPRLISTSQRLT